MCEVRDPQHMEILKRGAHIIIVHQLLVDPQTIRRVWKRACKNFNRPSICAFRALPHTKCGRQRKWDRDALREAIPTIPFHRSKRKWSSGTQFFSSHPSHNTLLHETLWRPGNCCPYVGVMLWCSSTMMPIATMATIRLFTWMQIGSFWLKKNSCESTWLLAKLLQEECVKHEQFLWKLCFWQQYPDQGMTMTDFLHLMLARLECGNW